MYLSIQNVFFIYGIVAFVNEILQTLLWNSDEGFISQSSPAPSLQASEYRRNGCIRTRRHRTSSAPYEIRNKGPVGQANYCSKESDGGSNLKQTSNTLKCPVCLDSAENPVTTNCGHIFCK